jgi:hypothetical protein
MTVRSVSQHLVGSNPDEIQALKFIWRTLDFNNTEQNLKLLGFNAGNDSRSVGIQC